MVGGCVECWIRLAFVLPACVGEMCACDTQGEVCLLLNEDCLHWGQPAIEVQGDEDIACSSSHTHTHAHTRTHTPQTQPAIEVEGDEDITCSYIPTHLEYILFELLKNAMRAVCERY